MSERIKIEQAIVVEGKYDKIKLSSIVSAVILVTNGYSIFKDAEKLALIRYYAKETGVVVLTDSDSAGFRIRNYLKGAIPGDCLTHVYIPDVFGKEKRKVKPSCEGKLGVEGIDKAVLLQAFAKAGVVASHAPAQDAITRMDLYELGLSGKPNSAALRKRLLKRLHLPELLSTTGLLEVLDTMLSRNELKSILAELEEE